MRKGMLRLGIAQMEAVLGEVDTNLEIVADLVQQAEEKGVELLLFPELALTGYPVDSWCEKATVRAGDTHIGRLKALSEKVALAIGLIEETEDVEFFNSAMFLEGGRIHHVHRKIYLPHYRHFDERRHFMSGWRVRAFDTPWGRMAMLICGDCWHVSLPYMAANDGADILLVLAASSREGLAPSINCQGAWQRLNRTNGLTLSTFVAFANHAGVKGGLHFYGGSHVVQPDGNLLGDVAGEEPELIVRELDLSSLRRQRLILPFRRDDSLALTIDLGRRVLNRKTDRQHGLLQLVGAPQLAYGAASVEESDPVLEPDSSISESPETAS